MANCTEKFNDDILRVDVYKAADVTLAIPAIVPGIATMANPVGKDTTPLLTLKVNPVDDLGDNEAEMTEHPTLKVTSKRQDVGNVFSHELSATIEDGYDTVQSALDTLRNGDAYLIYTTANEDKYMTITLPNCTGMTLTDSTSSNRTQTLKATVNSLSGLVKLTE